jgi:hypothetical protein
MKPWMYGSERLKEIEFVRMGESVNTDNYYQSSIMCCLLTAYSCPLLVVPTLDFYLVQSLSGSYSVLFILQCSKYMLGSRQSGDACGLRGCVGIATE